MLTARSPSSLVARCCTAVLVMIATLASEPAAAALGGCDVFPPDNI